MADLEKVIKGMELCLGSIDSAGCPEGCPYYEACQKYENLVVFQPLMRDALEALKTFHKPVFMVGSERCAGLKYAIEQETIKAGGQPLLVMRDVEMVPVPRVLTLEEIEDALDTVVWVEEPQVENLADRYGLIEAYSHKDGFVDIFFGFSDQPVTERYYYSDYGKTWRCWAYRPTDEQRKAVKWES